MAVWAMRIGTAQRRRPAAPPRRTVRYSGPAAPAAMRPLALAATLLAAMPLAASAQAVPDAPPYILTDARIYTVDGPFEVAEAMAVGPDGRIAAVGTARGAQALFPDWPTVPMGGRTIVPGLIDAHAHLMGLGQSLLQADLVGAASLEETLDRLRAFAATLPDGAWVTGRGWDQNDWPAQPDGTRPFPTRADLDAAFPERPVYLGRIDGHAAWANTAALRAAGLDPDAPAPPDAEGGQTLRDAEGRPTGVFVDGAMDLVGAAVPAPTAAAGDAALERALAETAKYGLTGVHEAGTDLAWIDRYRRFIADGRFSLRLYAMLTPEGVAPFCAANPVPSVDPSGRLVVRSLKLYADGALGSRGAALLADYADDPGNHGLLFRPQGELQATVAEAMRCGLQVNTHAIGDRANRVVLDAYEGAAAELGAALADGRHRIEHAQVVSLDDIERFARLGVTASVQPTHATSDMPWAERRVGPDRVRGAYAWRRLVDAGARLALGSDFPVERVNPLLGFHAAVTRQDATHAPAGGWMGNQALSRAEALRGFTLDAAHAAFMEGEVGSLDTGKRADFVVLSQDLMRVPPEQILATRVLATVVDGEPVYTAE